MAWPYVFAAFKQDNIPGNYQSVFLRIANETDDDGVCWRPVDELALLCDRSESLVYEAISDFIARGLLERAQTGHRGQRATYRLLLDVSQELPPADPAQRLVIDININVRGAGS